MNTKIENIYESEHYFDMNYVFEADFIVNGELKHFVEEWKPIPKITKGYQCSSFGRVKSAEQWVRRGLCKTGGIWKKSVIIKPVKNERGYFRIAATRKLKINVGRLVCLIFHGKPKSKSHQANHKDGIKFNNHSSNLEWVTPSQNIKHAHKIGLKTAVSGAQNKQSKPVAKLTSDGKIVDVFGSLLEAERLTGNHATNIRASTRGDKGHKTCGGYWWKDISHNEYHEFKAKQSI